jgi:hypothetical protein
LVGDCDAAVVVNSGVFAAFQIELNEADEQPCVGGSVRAIAIDLAGFFFQNRMADALCFNVVGNGS